MAFFNSDDLCETQNVEFKEASSCLPDDLWETYSAFANAEGGDIVLGVREDKNTQEFSIVGVPDARSLIDDFWSAVRNPQRVDRDVMLFDGVRSEVINGKDLVVIEVPRATRGEKPVRVYDKKSKGFVAYVRRERNDYKATEEDLRRMAYDNVPDVDRRPLERFDLDALCIDTVVRYRRIFAANKPTNPWNSLSDEDFLYRIGAVAKDHKGGLCLTQAGLLAFGYEYEITNYLPHYLLDYREVTTGSDRWDDRIVSQSGDWSGNLIDFYLMVSERLRRHFKAPFSADGNGASHSVRNPVMEAVNEAVANALVHGFYGGTLGVSIILRPHELEVANPGTFLIDRGVAIAGGFSEARNPTLMRFFSFMGVSDRAGSGLHKVYCTWEEEFNTVPCLTEVYHPAKIGLTLPLVSRVSEARPSVPATSASPLDDKAILTLFAANPQGLMGYQVAQLLGISERTAQKHLKDLTGFGLKRIKEGRSYRYFAE